MKKRFAAILLALCTLSMLLAGTALAADGMTITNGVLVEYTGDGGPVVIPDGVTAIGEAAFFNHRSVTSVKIPDSVTSIGSRAFIGCVEITSIDIPSSATTIEDQAFSMCHALQSVTIPAGVTVIKDWTFTSCEALTSVEIPAGVTSLGYGAFSGCFSLESVTIPASVTSIGDYAFSVCIKLTDVYYSGSQADWDKIAIGTNNEDLLGATLHCSGAESPASPAAPAQPEGPAAPASSTAYATSYSILVDGESVAFDAYALKDENGNDTNYLKLRDVAHVLNGSAAQFDVGWDGAAGAISITTGTAYASPNGSEMSTPFSGDQTYTENAAAIVIDGVPTDLAAITLTDANGGAYTYFKLRDLGQYLGFGVDWDAAAGAIVIDTTVA